jgi:hypothetical protein
MDPLFGQIFDNARACQNSLKNWRYTPPNSTARWSVTSKMLVVLNERIIVQPCSCRGGCSKCVEGLIERPLISEDLNETLSAVEYPVLQNN